MREQIESELIFVDEVKQIIGNLQESCEIITPKLVASCIGKVTPEGMDIIENIIEEVL